MIDRTRPRTPLALPFDVMTLSPDDSRPASQQVADVIRAEISSGALSAGAKVPSVRSLAERFGVAPMTAQSAIEILRDEGLIYTSPGRGSFVRDRPAQQTTDKSEPSAEYAAITTHLNALDAAVRDLASRLAELEALVQRERSAPQ
jgi:GntR family transcriptional regulator